jgi:putative DeoR family transcriptional regulator (stage III sporulation protein D)
MPVRDKAIRMGRYIEETRNTLSQTAKEFGVSLNTVRRYLFVVLPELNLDLAIRVRSIIDYHKAIAHLRGGEATKMKHKKHLV